ncbi:MAG: methionyl-tRNA formyltransferase [Desulfonatronovibrio sp.]
MAQEQKRIVFMGTPDFARIILEYVLAWPGGEVAAVYTQPDRPCGRGRKLKASPVKNLALEKGCPVLQPENFKDPNHIDELASFEPDYLLVAAYGLILPQKVLDTARQMPINVHASLLPRYRGAAPIQRAIMNSEVVTGVSIMLMTRGLDSGPVLLQRAMGIGIADTAGKLHDDLAHMGGEMLVEALEGLENGTVRPIDQDETQATYAPKLTKEEGLINWNQPAQKVHDRVRALFPWPGSWFDWTGPGRKTMRLQVFPGKVGPDKPEDTPPGTIAGTRDDFIEIACADKMYMVPRVKPEGCRAMNATDFECGFLSRC